MWLTRGMARYIGRPNPPFSGMSLAYRLLVDPVIVATVMIFMAVVLLIPGITSSEAQAFSIAVLPVVVLRARRRGL